MYEKVYVGTYESADGRQFGVEISRVTFEIFGTKSVHFLVCAIDLDDNAAWSESHFDSFKTLDEAMAYIDAL